MTLSCKLCSWGVGGAASPLTLFCYVSLQIRLYETPFLLTTHSNFSVLDFKLGVETNYPLAWMFFLHTLATAFPTSYRLKTVCSCWVWKLSNDACPLNRIPSAELYPSTFADLHCSWRIEFSMKDCVRTLAFAAGGSYVMLEAPFVESRGNAPEWFGYFTDLKFSNSLAIMVQWPNLFLF